MLSYVTYKASRESYSWAVETIHSKATKRVIAVHPGPSSPLRTWQHDNFVDLCECLMAEGFEVLRVGGPDTFSIPCDFDVGRHHSIDETAAALFGCCLFVGIESVEMLLAQSQGVPVVAILGLSLAENVLTEGTAVAVRHESGEIRSVIVESVIDAIHSLKGVEEPTT